MAYRILSYSKVDLSHMLFNQSHFLTFALFPFFFFSFFAIIDSTAVNSLVPKSLYIPDDLVKVNFQRLAKSFSHRHTSYYCASLYCTSQIFQFLQTEGSWQSCIKQVCRCHFSNSICSLCVSVSHFDNYQNISNPPPVKIMTYWRLRWWLALF